MNALTKIVLKRLSRVARPYLKPTGLLQTSGVYGRAAIAWRPGAERVLVLAPHMDDEVMGCGGALALHAQRGAHIVVAYMTDGCGGGENISTLAGAARTRAEREITRLRKEEARRALAVLGVHTLAFLDSRDGELQQCSSAIERLQRLLLEVRPEILYLPFYAEEHPDHRATSDVLLHAMQDVNAHFHCFGYEVWTPLPPNCLVRIDEVVELKRRALGEYASQLQQADYVHACLGLNAHRSIGLQGARNGYAEAFHAAPVDVYIEQYLAYCALRVRPPLERTPALEAHA
jgi:LmbE family N-acetylglucosaminyl deacetylase